MIRKQPEPLSYATQTRELRDVYNAPCRCGKPLSWTFSDDDPNITAIADCSGCEMRYVAGPLQVTIKIEGIDMSSM